MTRLSSDKDKIFQKIEVNGTTLDNFFKINPINNKSISFIKMDIEGAELLALKGAQKTIAKHKPIILMELCASNIKNFSYEITDIYEFFDKIDYVPIRALHNSDNFITRSKKDPSFNDDIILVHGSILK